MMPHLTSWTFVILFASLYVTDGLIDYSWRWMIPLLFAGGGVLLWGMVYSQRHWIYRGLALVVVFGGCLHFANQVSEVNDFPREAGTFYIEVTSPSRVGPGPWGRRTRCMGRGQFYCHRGGTLAAEGQFYVTMAFGQTLERGQIIRGRGVLSPLRQTTNPSQYDFRRHQRRRGTVALLFVKDPENVWYTSSSSYLLTSLDRLRHRGLSALDRLPPREGQIARSILLGDTSPTLRRSQRDFRRTGAAHFFAISGLHLGLILALVWGFLRLIGCPWRWSVFLGWAVLTGYLPLTGMGPPVIRAYVMATVFLVGEWFLLPRDIWNTWGVAGIFLLLVQPESAFSPGFHLSFGAVAAIALALQWMATWPIWGEGERTWPKSFGETVVLSLLVWLALAPLVAFHFDYVAPLGILANIVLLPLVTAVLVTGGFYLGGTALAGEPIIWMSYGIEWSAWAMWQINQGLLYLGDWSFIVPPTKWQLLYYYLFWGWLHLTWSKRQKWVWVLVAALPLLFVTRTTPPGRWSLSVLDVGPGVAVVQRLPSGQWVLYDCGTRSRFDVGRQVIGPYLRGRGTTSIDLVILSRPNPQNCRGIWALAEEFDIGRVVVSPAFLRKDYGRQIISFLNHRQIPLTIGGKGDRWWGRGGEVIEILSPPPVDHKAYQVGVRNQSLVVTCSWKGQRIWLAGANGKWGMAQARQGEPRPLSVALIPHLGSRGNPHLPLAEHITPHFAIHTGRYQLDPSVSQVYRHRGSTLLSTAEWGALELVWSRGSWQWKPQLEQRRIPPVKGRKRR